VKVDFQGRPADALARRANGAVHRDKATTHLHEASSQSLLGRTTHLYNALKNSSILPPNTGYTRLKWCVICSLLVGSSREERALFAHFQSWAVSSPLVIGERPAFCLQQCEVRVATTRTVSEYSGEGHLPYIESCCARLRYGYL